MKGTPTRRRLGRPASLVAATLLTTSATLVTGVPLASAAPTGTVAAAELDAAPAALEAPAAAEISEIADRLRDNPVYVDPEAAGQLSRADADALSDKIEESGRPVFLAVLPADYPTDDIFADLRAATGVTGVYGIRVGDRFDARADSSVMSRQAVGNLARSVDGEPAAQQLNDFTDRAVSTMRGSAPDGWNGRTAGEANGVGALVTVGALAAAVGGSALLVSRRGRRRTEAAQKEALQRLRVVVDEDITAYGEELDRLDFHPAEPGADDAMRADYARALDSYEEAKRKMAAAGRPDDVKGVTETLEDGRYALSVLAARREGRPLPERRAPCFFDPRHGPSVADARWTPPGGTAREVPVCAADQARLADGLEPMIREVDTGYGNRRPYWDAGPAYGPWAGGYFGGALLPGLLVGTMLGGMMAGPAYGAGWGDGYGGGYEGGDFSGGDFNSGDFGGGFGGGDFGGGGF
ncbi:hypothetical protein [Streptomyces sp. MJP52]|uniref:hypothetical protein n=1 Tax=Streptomyces sp. MJP52 TaxID=2940555 RepID=UPI002474F9D2|nr:hypothetical protein [Streptomyces sp. MJP52]MDH6224814.1 hypothetical protein [Streptomyces sp. MJP52]